MIVRPATVVVGWVSANLAGAVLLVLFKENAFGYVLYFASAVPISVFGVLLWRVGKGQDRGDRQGERLTLPGSSSAVVVLAVGLTLIGLGLVFGAWLWIIGILVSAGALIALVRNRGISGELPEHVEDLPLRDPVPSPAPPTAERGSRS